MPRLSAASARPRFSRGGRRPGAAPHLAEGPAASWVVGAACALSPEPSTLASSRPSEPTWKGVCEAGAAGGQGMARLPPGGTVMPGNTDGPWGPGPWVAGRLRAPSHSSSVLGRWEEGFLDFLRPGAEPPGDVGLPHYLNAGNARTFLNGSFYRWGNRGTRGVEAHAWLERRCGVLADLGIILGSATRRGGR